MSARRLFVCLNVAGCDTALRKRAALTRVFEFLQAHWVCIHFIPRAHAFWGLFLFTELATSILNVAPRSGHAFV